VVHALTVWRCYLEGTPEFRVVTDHKAITYLDNLPTLRRRQTRWAEFVSRFTFRWDFVPGTSNVVADALSRHPSDYQVPCPIIQAVVLSGFWNRTQRHRCLTVRPLCALIGTLRAAGEGTASASGEGLSWKDKFVQGYAHDL
jgi:RNase H-like domain found in reverse transcriptase